MSDPAAALALASSGLRFAPEDNPFRTVIADVTHRCNMVCRNCYIPNRDVPDLDADWLIALIARFPRRIRLRIACRPRQHVRREPVRHRRHDPGAGRE